MHRTHEVQAAYDQHQANSDGGCDFCRVPAEQIVAETTTQRVIHNIFPYAIWDFQPVSDHLMIVPKRHVLSLIDQTEAENQEFMQLMTSYEAHGYSVYIRAPQNELRSIAHIHTHLFLLPHVKS